MKARAEDQLVADFIRTRGVTKCPPAAGWVTTASISPEDQAALNAHAVRRAGPDGRNWRDVHRAVLTEQKKAQAAARRRGEAKPKPVPFRRDRLPSRAVENGWRDSELAILRAHYRAEGPQGCQKRLPGRSLAAIKKVATIRLGLRMNRRREDGWTDAEQRIMREHYPTGGWEKCHELMPGRPRETIRRYASRLD